VSYHYLNDELAADPTKIPNIEVFEAAYALCPECSSLIFDPTVTRGTVAQCVGSDECAADEMRVALDKVGWFWWYCQPGCLPDSEAEGPFRSEEDALEDARG
jgi:hypothetical protein